MLHPDIFCLIGKHHYLSGSGVKYNMSSKNGFRYIWEARDASIDKCTLISPFADEWERIASSYRHSGCLPMVVADTDITTVLSRTLHERPWRTIQAGRSVVYTSSTMLRYAPQIFLRNL